MRFKGVSLKETVNMHQWGSKIHTHKKMFLLTKSIYYHCKSVKSWRILSAGPLPEQISFNLKEWTPVKCSHACTYPLNKGISCHQGHLGNCPVESNNNKRNNKNKILFVM